MSTNDVPGYDPRNRDELAAGCWAEHEDGSLIFVMGTEGARVVYSIFEMAQDPITEYRDAMPESGFKSQFSWSSGDGKKTGIKWTWHDKTPFPWDRVIKAGARDGIRYASADDLLSAAARVAQSRSLRAGTFRSQDYDHLRERVGPRGREIIDRVQGALDELRDELEGNGEGEGDVL